MIFVCIFFLFFFFKQKTAYEMRISDWSSDVCSSDLGVLLLRASIYTQLTHAYTQNSSLYATILASKTHMLGGRAPPGLPTVRSTPSHYTIYSNGCRLCRQYSPPSAPRLTSRARSPHPHSAAVCAASGLDRTRLV